MSKAGNDFNNPSKAMSIRKTADVDNFHGTIVPDPFRWLENLDDPEVKSWAAAQNERAVNFIKDSGDLDELKSEIEVALSYHNESLPTKHGDHWFMLVKAPDMQQWVLARRDTPLGESEIILNPNEWSDNATISLQTYEINEKGSFVAFAKSSGGTDVATIEFLETATGEILKDKIEQVRWPALAWDNEGGIFYEIAAEDESKRRGIKHHKLGTPTGDDKDVFWPEKDNMMAEISRSKGSGTYWIRLLDGTDKNNGYAFFTSLDPEIKNIFPVGRAELQIIGEINGMVYVTTSDKADRKRIMKFDLNSPDLENWKEIVPEHEEGIIDAAFIKNDKLYVSYLLDCANCLKVLDLNGNDIGEVAIPPQSIIQIGSENSDPINVFLTVSNPLFAATAHMLDTLDDTLSVHRKSECPVNLDGCVTERLYATSKDGTKVPMTVIRRADVALDGNAAVCLYGYGGFNVPILPGFSMTQWAWVKSGGIFVDTNLRGGGEFGSKWYEEGKLHNKQNVFDDFNACAEHLIENGYTQKGRIMSYGGSNGGLLTLATMIQRPDLYGSVYSAVPVTDMLRFMIPTFGAYWVSDYGDPVKSEEDFKVSMNYSPLHTVKPGAVYPPLLIETAHGDDRVVPWHSYKQTATLNDQCPESPVYLKVDMDTGHGAGKSKAQMAVGIAEMIGWAIGTLGPLDPSAYQKSLGSNIGFSNKLEI